MLAWVPWVVAVWHVHGGCIRFNERVITPCCSQPHACTHRIPTVLSPFHYTGYPRRSLIYSWTKISTLSYDRGTFAARKTAGPGTVLNPCTLVAARPDMQWLNTMRAHNFTLHYFIFAVVCQRLVRIHAPTSVGFTPLPLSETPTLNLPLICRISIRRVSLFLSKL